MAQRQLTNPLPNVTSPLARVEITVNGKKIEGKAFLIPPWNSYFQQFVQQAPAVLDITELTSDYGNDTFSVTPNVNGNFVITGGVITSLFLTRGNVSIDINGQKIIPIRIGDTLTITYLGSINFPDNFKFFPD